MAHKWIQVWGDVDAVVFGGTFIRETKPDSSYCDMFMIRGFNTEETTRTVEVLRKKPGCKDTYGPDSFCKLYHLTLPEKIEVYRLDIEWSDPLINSWVNWDDVLKFSGDDRKPEDIPAWNRIMLVGDYYGWANFGEPDYLTEGEIRSGTLRGALKRVMAA